MVSTIDAIYDMFPTSLMSNLLYLDPRVKLLENIASISGTPSNYWYIQSRIYYVRVMWRQLLDAVATKKVPMVSMYTEM